MHMAEVPLPTPTQAPVPSTDIRNAVFAGAKLDEEVTGSGEYYTDRLGVNRLTNTGRNNQFNSAQVDRANRFEQFLLSSGYVFLGDYEDGPFQFSARNQYIRYDNQYYRLNAETDVGYTTTGTDATSFANDVMHFVLMDGDSLRQDLGSNEPGNGGSIVALEQGGTVQGAIKYVTPFMFKNLVSDGDWTSALAAADIVARDLGLYVDGMGQEFALGASVTLRCAHYRNIRLIPTSIYRGLRLFGWLMPPLGCVCMIMWM